MTNNDPTLSGEARFKAKRSAFWRYLGISFAVSLVAGIVLGTVVAVVAAGYVSVALMGVIWLVAIIGYAWFTRDYFRRIDELDLLDNLWASTIAFYVYVVTLGSWWLFHQIDVVSEPQQYIIAAVAGAALVLAYVARKLGWR